MSKHIKINDVVPRVQYHANGSQTAFVYPFPVFRAGDLRVFIDNGPMSGGFTVTGAGSSDGGTVVFDTPPAAGRLVTLRRALPLRRVTDFLQGSDLRADSFNDEFDTLTALVQQLDEALSRAIVAPAHDKPAALGLPERGVRAGRVLMFDSGGNLALGDPDQVVSPFEPFTQPLDGARPRDVYAKLADTVSVKDFGAVGDGLTDDTAALQAALAAAKAVHVPPGSYLVSDTLTLGNGQSLYGAGDGSMITTSAGALPLIELTAGYAAVHGLRLVGGAVGIRLNGRTGPCVQNSLHDLSIWQAGTGILLDGFQHLDRPCYWNTLRRILVARPAVHGVHLRKSGDGDAPGSNRFDDVRVYSLSAPISGSGFYVEHGDNSNVFTGCQADLSAGAHSCFRVGGGARRTHIADLFTKASGTVDNLVLEPGADETTVINLHAASAGAALADHSGGTTIAVNAGWPVRVRLPRTHITELEVGQLTTGTLKHAVAYIENLATYDVAMASRVHLISAWSGPVTARLPAPGGTVGYLVTLKKSDASANGVTVVDADGGQPDGQTTVLAGHGDFVTVVSNGAAWWIVGRSG